MTCTVVVDGNKRSVDLINLFGRAEKRKELTSKDRKAIRWKAVAEGWIQDKNAVKSVVAEFPEDRVASKDVAEVIRKYADTEIKRSKAESFTLQFGNFGGNDD
ncbi:MAG: hypothetical protein ACE3L7_33130 [Candidatus Pristimantibacillus sp.]